MAKVIFKVIKLIKLHKDLINVNNGSAKIIFKALLISVFQIINYKILIIF